MAFTIFDTIPPKWADGSAGLCPGQGRAVEEAGAAGDLLTVEAELPIVRHDPAPGFAGFTELRLVRAVVRRLP